ncbi:carbon-nitrogen hydrolase family protein [Brevibacillus choshinensis]|uniref:CN hydrolase domain-containing protein n=1 Tax=Brevibacillus choshinensis TaxID=54911 RepID=A0ABR5N0H5_BRECH|nr:carbon-nitrogen hydrolase family protein [Brevibacillus choshinensis]KQL43992.1 hypothetical protein AN963_21335 [Brevibacillus choshinensis]MED4586124.1 carbon-nitrogen hydrolase family protein [Brevibacillus choshinensis]MED4754746.1 carbon-nitrogen hydrolase family protein [Brevibacillus choshinensis]MED4784735.1 carbon-nitrogen hydrolase family protein [Brevibacillus choshinensis]
MSLVTIAIAQIRTKQYDKKSNTHRALTIMRDCKEKGVDYLLFPEMYLTGSYIYDQVPALAEPKDGPHIRVIQEEASRLGIGVIFGFPELAGNKYYNSAAFIDKDGHLNGVYRKVHLFDKEVGIYSPGEEFPVFRTDFGNFALKMTFDTGFPELTRLYALQGAQIVMGLHAHHVPYQTYHELMLRVRAMENQIFIAVANKVGLEKNNLFFGVSSIITPNGEHLYKGGNNEEIRIETIDLAEVNRERERTLMKYLDNRQPRLYAKIDGY